MQNYTVERDAVLAALTSFLEAIENKDAQGAIRWFDTQAVTFDFAPPLENRFDALSDPSALEEWFKTWNGPIHTDLLPPHVLVSGDLAVVHGLQRMRGKKKEGAVHVVPGHRRAHENRQRVADFAPAQLGAHGDGRLPEGVDASHAAVMPM